MMALTFFFQDGLEDCAGLEDGPCQNLKDNSKDGLWFEDSLDDDGEVR